MQKKFAVIGFPLTHTMSPFIHKRLFELNGLNCRYDVIEIPPEKLCENANFLKTLDGYNITIPHKEAIIPLIDKLDASATTYNAVNTVKSENNISVGYNTDATGFKNALALEDIPFCGKMLICGAGGVARTVAIEAAKNNLDITVAVRNTSSCRALNLKNELKIRFNTEISLITLDDVKSEFDIAVNGTPLGMYPNINSSPLKTEQLKNIKYLFDTVYNPTETLLVKNAKSVGVKAINGMGMLVLQAAKAQNIWYGAEFNSNDLKQLIEDAKNETERIFKNV